MNTKVAILGNAELDEKQAWYLAGYLLARGIDASVLVTPDQSCELGVEEGDVRLARKLCTSLISLKRGKRVLTRYSPADVMEEA